MRPQLTCADPDVRSVAESWHTVTPTALMTARPDESKAERVENASGATFVNIVFGDDRAGECTCCDVFSFQEERNARHLVAFVGVRRARDAADAAALAERIWAAAEKPLRFTSAEVGERHLIDGSIRTSDGRLHIAELLIRRDRETDSYVVRVYVGEAQEVPRGASQ